MNDMGNNQIKKRAAEAHNKKRKERVVELARVAQDRIDNPEKYARTGRQRRATRRAQMFIATATGIGAL